MKLFKISLIVIAIIASLALPFVILAADQPDNQQTCPKTTQGHPTTLQECQKWIQEQVGSSAGYGSNTVVSEADLANRVGRIISMILSVFGIVFLCLVIFSGIQWMTAGGNEEKVSHARERIMRAAIGLGIIAMSWALTKFIVTTMQTTTAPAAAKNACEQVGGHCAYTPAADPSEPCTIENRVGGQPALDYCFAQGSNSMRSTCCKN
ncbi:MAG: pilin [Candidatus Komeilibacteria bacterium]|nr:pilin [Candidatus Komeilibacteria bacterium]